jgi:hypothetical protein
LELKRAFPSCAETLTIEKKERKEINIISLWPAGLRGIIDAIDTEKCG